ncbi:diguanylate phosphodiesterase [Alkalidesulfovibrio alkalitolerans DSM 16529]|jgi:EAL domain-containing protein (putative c-di-GMP-specific phosphodiesterase class I)|uniref:Diguanylate phosphodiesterase n=1 Tax=Alkalidesulfovibrio alkalitolerans DSM 16529 TaxID=1121439 RepID=S7UGK9_9BACT|nr:EAL domain-containing protein [Alkalidesulfovibrio alkalitolerans]EPR32969.1 diguanylate phosphodiesterase [Alkalidesulfovibrio alkalitolerans DSM 16529]
MQTFELSLDAILARRLLTAHLQPIVSLKRQRVFGVEALARGLSPCTGNGKTIIPPATLFAMADESSSRLALDRLCRETALAAFAALHANDPGLLLHVNLDGSILNDRTVGSGHMLRSARQHGVAPGNVVIEVIESRVDDSQALLRFAEGMREAGFLLALDDVGAGHSNLDRIPLLRPDIIKMDRSLIAGIDQVYHQQVIAASLVKMAARIGALVIAEGVEHEAEVLTLMEIGVELFQGWHFARAAEAANPLPDLSRLMSDTATTFRRHQMAKITARKRLHAMYAGLSSEIAERLGARPPEEFDELLCEALALHPALECLYVLDESGRQSSETVCREPAPRQGRLLYQPARKGADHSLKDYYLPLAAGLSRYTSEPYISLASGSLCQTIAARFEDRDGALRILCMDVVSQT